MKKTGKKSLVALLSALLAVSVMLNVASAASLVEITAYLNNEIKIMLNGKLFEPNLADGTKIVPITYQGTTYLPLRAISEAVGLETTWDGARRRCIWGAEADSRPAIRSRPSASRRNSRGAARRSTGQPAARPNI
jgi:hypothetical protein